MTAASPHNNSKPPLSNHHQPNAAATHGSETAATISPRHISRNNQEHQQQQQHPPQQVQPAPYVVHLSHQWAKLRVPLRDAVQSTAASLLLAQQHSSNNQSIDEVGAFRHNHSQGTAAMFPVASMPFLRNAAPRRDTAAPTEGFLRNEAPPVSSATPSSSLSGARADLPVVATGAASSTLVTFPTRAFMEDLVVHSTHPSAAASHSSVHGAPGPLPVAGGGGCLFTACGVPTGALAVDFAASLLSNPETGALEATTSPLSAQGGGGIVGDNGSSKNAVSDPPSTNEPPIAPQAHFPKSDDVLTSILLPVVGHDEVFLSSCASLLSTLQQLVQQLELFQNAAEADGCPAAAAEVPPPPAPVILDVGGLSEGKLNTSIPEEGSFITFSSFMDGQSGGGRGGSASRAAARRQSKPTVAITVLSDPQVAKGTNSAQTASVNESIQAAILQHQQSKRADQHRTPQQNPLQDVLSRPAGATPQIGGLTAGVETTTSSLSSDPNAVLSPGRSPAGTPTHGAVGADPLLPFNRISFSVSTRPNANGVLPPRRVAAAAAHQQAVPPGAATILGGQGTHSGNTRSELGSFVSHIFPHQSFVLTNKLVRDEDDVGMKRLNNEYTFLETLGQGACGKVKLAYSATRGIPVAVKIVRRGGMNAAAKRGLGSNAAGAKEQALRQEIAVMKKLRHKNIVSLFEVIDDPAAAKMYLVMQYIDKGSVGSVQTDGRCTPVEPSRLAMIARQVAAGLDYLHSHGVVHRDIKPENILHDREGRAYLADFGVASTFGASMSISRKTDMNDVSMSRARPPQLNDHTTTTYGASLMAPTTNGAAEASAVIAAVAGTPLFIAPEMLVKRFAAAAARAAQAAEEDDDAVQEEEDDNGEPRQTAAQRKKSRSLDSLSTSDTLSMDELQGADAWSFGVTLFTLYCGKIPFPAVEDVIDYGEGLAELPPIVCATSSATSISQSAPTDVEDDELPEAIMTSQAKVKSCAASINASWVQLISALLHRNPFQRTLPRDARKKIKEIEHEHEKLIREEHELRAAIELYKRGGGAGGPQPVRQRRPSLAQQRLSAASAMLLVSRNDLNTAITELRVSFEDEDDMQLPMTASARAGGGSGQNLHQPRSPTMAFGASEPYTAAAANVTTAAAASYYTVAAPSGTKPPIGAPSSSAHAQPSQPLSSHMQQALAGSGSGVSSSQSTEECLQSIRVLAATISRAIGGDSSVVASGRPSGPTIPEHGHHAAGISDDVAQPLSDIHCLPDDHVNDSPSQGTTLTTGVDAPLRPQPPPDSSKILASPSRRQIS